MDYVLPIICAFFLSVMRTENSLLPYIRSISNWHVQDHLMIQ